MSAQWEKIRKHRTIKWGKKQNKISTKKKEWDEDIDGDEDEDDEQRQNRHKQKPALAQRRTPWTAKHEHLATD